MSSGVQEDKLYLMQADSCMANLIVADGARAIKTGHLFTGATVPSSAVLRSTFVCLLYIIA